MIKLLPYSTDLVALNYYINPTEFLLVEKFNGLDELKIVTTERDLFKPLVDIYCMMYIDPSDPFNNLKFFILDKTTIEEEDGTRFTLREPFFAFDARKQITARTFDAVAIGTFTQTIINTANTGNRKIANIDWSNFSPSTSLQVTRAMLGDDIPEAIGEEYYERDMKFYFDMKVSGGELSFIAGVQPQRTVPDIVISKISQNLRINDSYWGEEFSNVYVYGELKVENVDDPVPVTGTAINTSKTGLRQYEHWVDSQIDTADMNLTVAQYQRILNSEALRIQKNRRATINIAVSERIKDTLPTTGIYNRTGNIFLVEINAKLTPYVVTEVQTTQEIETFELTELI